ncbi:MAG: hypothetical protein RL095_3641 [Verrucomicrobiota bacterium]|jgi:hypothetical protein
MKPERKKLSLGAGKAGDDEINSMRGLAGDEGDKGGEGDKVRITHYLSTQILERLDSTYSALRQELPFELKTKLKKSHLVDLALATLLEDYQKQGAESALGRHLKSLRK